MNSWSLMVALIGEGQEIHLGEESGLPQWNDALTVMKKEWFVHCPDRIAQNFHACENVATSIYVGSHHHAPVSHGRRCCSAGSRPY